MKIKIKVFIGVFVFGFNFSKNDEKGIAPSLAKAQQVLDVYVICEMSETYYNKNINIEANINIIFLDLP